MVIFVLNTTIFRKVVARWRDQHQRDATPDSSRQMLIGWFAKSTVAQNEKIGDAVQVVMGELNGTRLLDLMNGAVGRCNRISAAVAYASRTDPFFEHCQQHGIFLEYYGLLDEGAAVSISVLQQMLRAGPLSVQPRVIKGHFHSKIIWWHGYGAYIGSANLTANAWFTNVECGVFFEDSEILGHSLESDLQLQLDYLWKVSEPVTSELVNALDKLRPVRSDAYVAQKRLRSQFELATGGIKTHVGLTSYGPPTETTAFTQFTSEWNETLELLRGLRKEFQRIGKSPTWVEPTADPTVHFDQFLHAFYYVKVRDEGNDEESARTVDLVNRSHEKNRSDTVAALQEAIDWWAAIPEAPYGEDEFIHITAPRMRLAFSEPKLREWTIQDFQDVFFDVHAFRMHARQMRNVYLGLPRDHKENIRARSDRVATWLWNQPRTESQAHIRELLKFLIWGESPFSMVERLWSVTREERWRYDHFGPSTLGEAVGWARPSDFPPRNNRTNKALRALGHNVRLFSN